MANNKANFIIRLQRWMDSVPGQTFLNYAYSWGAAIVILGTLFKLTHIPGANFMLFLGMGTEVFVFFLSGFDRPFDKTQQSEIAEDYLEEDNKVLSGTNSTTTPSAQPVVISSVSAPQGVDTVSSVTIDSTTVANVAAQATATQQLLNTVGVASQNVLSTAQAACNPEMEEAVKAYVDQLKNLTEALARVSDQIGNLSQDASVMENLNRTLSGINAIYDVQLKNISAQLGTIDKVNSQTDKLASQIEELNGIYQRMIEAMTVNMRK
ncbi:MAG: gliding motility protein GldL [Paraprevotella sp.]|nr:gliding motility protein GldL [Paraprevotella sp.]